MYSGPTFFHIYDATKTYTSHISNNDIFAEAYDIIKIVMHFGVEE